MTTATISKLKLELKTTLEVQPLGCRLQTGQLRMLTNDQEGVTMKIAITGGTGFVGTHLTHRLLGEGHEVVQIARTPGRQEVEFVASDLSNVNDLKIAFADCDAVAHCAGINRELGKQTFKAVHVDGTRNVIEAAKAVGVKRLALVSFLRARPDCGSPYHESKWQAEELVRNCGIDFTIFKAGVIYGRGDHMLDHLSHALHTFPIFALVGTQEKSVCPLAIEDFVHAMRASLVDGRLKNQTVAIVGPEEIYLSEAVRRVAEVVGKNPFMFRLPIWCHEVLAHIFEATMKVPLASLAQIRILSEGMMEPGSPVTKLPYDLLPTRRFTVDQIRNGLPEAKTFGVGDLRWCS